MTTTTQKTIRTHNDCTIIFDIDKLAEITNICSGNEDDVLWAANAHVDLFIDDEGVWLLPDDDCPLGNGAVLPLSVVAPEADLVSLIDAAFCLQATSERCLLPINPISVNGVTIDMLGWDREGAVIARVISGDWIDLDTLQIELDEFEAILRELIAATDLI